MGDVTRHTIERVVAELDTALEHQLGGLVKATTTITWNGNEPTIETSVELPLRASNRTRINKTGLQHAADAEAFVRAMLDEHHKPFTSRLERAATEAIVAWQGAIAR